MPGQLVRAPELRRGRVATPPESPAGIPMASPPETPAGIPMTSPPIYRRAFPPYRLPNCRREAGIQSPGTRPGRRAIRTTSWARAGSPSDIPTRGRCRRLAGRGWILTFVRNSGAEPHSCRAGPSACRISGVGAIRHLLTPGRRSHNIAPRVTGRHSHHIASRIAGVNQASRSWVHDQAGVRSAPRHEPGQDHPVTSRPAVRDAGSPGVAGS